REQAESLGFRFHTIDGAPYWDERAYYAFGLRQIEDDIEQPTQELHDMAMALVDEVVGSEQLLERLAIPREYWDWIADSWRRGEPPLYGRMDLAYDGRGPAKLYELNYDTPTSLYEAAYFQWLWLEQSIARGVFGEGSDQYNRIQELLIETFGTLARDGRIAT
ncbi:glutathionylspermidine synthase family protein, partial [Staphylococcus pseudintermedius]|nr:glutathionylspermidine synthase family protein [Staphylococcus pseudintermedius]